MATFQASAPKTTSARFTRWVRWTDESGTELADIAEAERVDIANVLMVLAVWNVVLRPDSLPKVPTEQRFGSPGKCTPSSRRAETPASSLRSTASRAWSSAR